MKHQDKMDAELAILLGVTRHLPDVRGTGALANALRRLYLRKPRRAVDAMALGVRMLLDPRENVDGELLFCPQIRDRHEMAFLGDNLRLGEVFLDIGANVGIYSLVASSLVGETGMVLAIEPEPLNYSKLCANIRLNDARNVTALNVGVAGEAGTLRLRVNTKGNRAGSTFMDKSSGTPNNSVEVTVSPLSILLTNQRITRVKGAKFDIEGFEYRVLSKFFADVGRDLYPRFIIIEHDPQWVSLAGGDALELLMHHGYRTHSKARQNYILCLAEWTDS